MAEGARSATGAAAPDTSASTGGRRHGRFHGRGHDEVSIITEARPSYDEEFRARRKRYVIMMAMRLPCLVLAVALYHTPWLAVLIILISIPLPWMAVLIANDGPARKQRRVPRGVANDQRALPTGPVDVVDVDAASRGDR